MKTVKDLINILQAVPDNFKDSTVFIDDQLIKQTWLDTEHGEFNICAKDSKNTKIEVSPELMIALLSTSHPSGKFMFDYRGVSAEALEDVFHQALAKIKEKYKHTDG